MNYKIAGSIFIVLGLLSVWNITTHAMRGTLYLNFIIFFLPIGIGLIMGRESSRKWAITWMWILMFLTLATSAFVLFANWIYNGKLVNPPFYYRIIASFGCFVVGYGFYYLKNRFQNNPILKAVPNQTLNRTE